MPHQPCSVASAMVCRLHGFQALFASVFMLMLMTGCGQGSEDSSQVLSSSDNFETKVVSGQTHTIDNCLFEKHRYIPALSATSWTTETDVQACQRRCAAAPGCEFFSFFRGGRCVQSGKDAYYVPEITATAGPRRCEKIRASCSEKPGPGFPGATDIESMLAWPSNRVPGSLECWPIDWQKRVYESCEAVQVLQNMSDGLPGRCTNLKPVAVPLYETCHSVCRKMAFCSTFQLTDTGCFIGTATSGLQCYAPRSERTLRAERYMHGDVRVLMDLRGVQVKGLTKVFDQSDVDGDVRTLGVKACRDACYSNLFCQYWQYYWEDGCWVEEPQVAQPVERPLTTANFRKGYATAIAGEYIQHFCPGLGWTPSQEWNLVASGTTCATSGIKDLAGSDAVGVAGCKARASADAACGTEMYSNGLACFCMLKGNTCERQPSSYGFSLFEREDLVPEATSTTPSNEPQHSHAPDSAQEFHVEIELMGLNYDNLNSIYAAKDSFEEKCESAIELATGASSQQVQDLDGTPGMVDVTKSSKHEGHTAVHFDMELPSHHTPDSLSRALWSQAFEDAVQAAARQAAPAAITGPIKVVPYFSSKVRHINKGARHRKWWHLTAMVLIGLVAVLCCVVFLCMFWNRSRHGQHQRFPMQQELCADSDSDEFELVDARADSRRVEGKRGGVKRQGSSRHKYMSEIFKPGS